MALELRRRAEEAASCLFLLGSAVIEHQLELASLEEQMMIRSHLLEQQAVMIWLARAHWAIVVE